MGSCFLARLLPSFLCWWELQVLFFWFLFPSDGFLLAVSSYTGAATFTVQATIQECLPAHLPNLLLLGTLTLGQYQWWLYTTACFMMSTCVLTLLNDEMLFRWVTQMYLYMGVQSTGPTSISKDHSPCKLPHLCDMLIQVSGLTLLVSGHFDNCLERIPNWLPSHLLVRGDRSTLCLKGLSTFPQLQLLF